MLIATADPLVGDRVSGYVSAEAGEEDTWGFEGAVNIPLGERSALRLVGSHKDRGDYLSYDDGTELGVVLQIRRRYFGKTDAFCNNNILNISLNNFRKCLGAAFCWTITSCHPVADI